MRLFKVTTISCLGALTACCVVVAGCGEGGLSALATTTTSVMSAAVTTTEAPTTTTSTSQRLSVQFGTGGEGVISANPDGSGLVGSWHQRGYGYGLTLGFMADGTCYISIPGDGECEGDAAHGTYEVSGNKLTVYGMTVVKWSCTYSIRNGVLRMPEPGGDATVYEWTR